MNRSEEIVSKFNEMLNSDQFNQNEFDSLITIFKERYKPDVKFLDFKYYNDYRRRLAKREKINYVKNQKFEEAVLIYDFNPCKIQVFQSEYFKFGWRHKLISQILEDQ